LTVHHFTSIENTNEHAVDNTNGFPSHICNCI
jgi:hypothetical protein